MGIGRTYSFYVYIAKKKMNPLLLCKYLENRADEEEMRQVIDWLNADPAHCRELDALDRVFWASALSGHPDADAVRKPRRMPVWRRTVRWALQAAAVLCIGFGVAELLLHHRVGEWTERTVALDVPAGQYLSLKLEDGTTAWLNSGTRLEYPAVFAGGERRVKVSGEAMFDVAYDAEHPFIVETFACDVEVLGTKFDVTADEAESRFSVSLLRGRVKATSRLDPTESCVLNPDEAVHLENGHLSRRLIADSDEFLWTRGIISIKGQGFEELMRKFERCFGVKIVIASETVPQVGYNHGKIRISDGVDSALRLLQMASDFTYEKNSETGVITIR